MHYPPSSSLGNAIIAAFAMLGSVLPETACAQIFGTVDSNGAVVLTNVRDKPGLRVIVAAGPAAEPGAKRRSRKSSSGNLPLYADVIDEASRNFRVQPELLRAVIDIESGYNPNAVSEKGALGLMQLMPDTARRFSEGDMFNPRDNVLAGARYLRFLLDLFKDDVELTLAAYNAGENAVIRAGYRVPSLPETRLYVPRVLARYKQLLSAS